MGETVPAGQTLGAPEYERLLSSTETERERLVVRLAGEAGLRPVEIVGVEPCHVEGAGDAGGSRSFLRVPTDEEDRLTPLPRGLEDAIDRYATTMGRSDQERLIDVSPRRVQMIVSEVADRAAESGDPALCDVSSRALRRFHARSLLGAGIRPRTVLAVTVWRRLDTLVDGSAPPDEATIFEATGTTHRPADVVWDTPGRQTDGALADHRVAHLVDRVVQLGVSLSSASTREAIEREACDELATIYEYAWIASDTGNDRLELRAASAAGTDGDEDLPEVPAGTVSRDVVESGGASVVTNVDGVPAAYSDAAATAVVQIAHADTSYGVLAVGIAEAPEQVTDREQRMLEDLGRRLGQAVAAVERRRLLLADTVVRLSFRCTDDRAVLVRLSAVLDCSFTLTGLVPSEDGALLAFVWLEGARPEDVFARATDTEAVDSARLIRSGEDGALIEFVLTTDSPALTLVECGGSLTELTAADGQGRFTAEFVPDVDVREVVESIESAFPASEMVAKREVERSVQTETEFRQALEDTLTDKQRSALRAAHLSGYFDWPRGSTAEELAESLGVTSPTFHSHLRRAQRKLLANFFEDGEP